MFSDDPTGFYFGHVVKWLDREIKAGVQEGGKDEDEGYCYTIDELPAELLERVG